MPTLAASGGLTIISRDYAATLAIMVKKIIMIIAFAPMIML
jgi:hypothetical protein